MSKIFKKSNIMPVVILSAICIVIALVLGVANMFTQDKIAENEEEKIYGSLKVVLDGNFEEVGKPEGAPKSVNSMFKVTDDEGNLLGHVVTLSVQGYASVISVTVGVDTEGTVTKAVVTSQAESHGKPGMANYIDKFTGVSQDKVSSVDTFSGATVSSTAMKKAVVDAVNTVMGKFTEEETIPELARDESEIIALAEKLVGKDVEMKDVTPDGLEYVKRVYKAGNEGYVFYAHVYSTRYSRPETETLVYVNNDGKIENVNKLIWKTSDAGWGYEPPTEETVDKFYDKIIGMDKKDITALGNADLVSNATSTSTSLRLAIYEGMSAVEKIESGNISRIVGISLLALAILGFAAYKIVPEIKKRRKNG